MRSDNSSTGLIDYALRYLVPDVFCHPVWAHFVNAGDALPLEQYQSLLGAVDEMLAARHSEDACRVLFMCAFQRLRVGDDVAASHSIQRILGLAEQYDLPHIAACAAWGAAAISVRRGAYRQAAEHLEHLQSILEQQREWILSDVIDVIRHALLNQPEAVALDQLLLSDAGLSSVIAPLLCWGTPAAVDSTNCNASPNGCHNHADTARSPAGSPGSRWQAIWQAIKHIATGKLRLKWVAVTNHCQTAVPDEHEQENPTSEALASVPAHHPNTPRALSPAEEPEPLEQTGTASGLATEPSIRMPMLTVYTLGACHLAVNDIPINHIIVGKSRTVFEYLLIHHQQPVPRDVLMEIFWPNAGPDSARNRLNVALHHVRQALRQITDFPIVLFEEGAYSITAELDLWIDAEEFERHVAKGRQLEAANRLLLAIKEYELARDIYQGDFLADEPYEDWPILPRERLRTEYLDALDRLSRIYFSQDEYAACAALCQMILAHDNCHEEAHCRLMQCYSRQNQRYLALRQYQACLNALRAELDIDPAPATTQLYERVRRRETV